MPWIILQRYVFWELLRVFVLALVALTGIMVMAGIVQEASQQGLGPEQIVKLVPLLVPSTLPYTLPATVLFAVSLVYGRLSHDNELTAIKAAGIPLTRMITPSLVFGAACSGGIFFLYREFIPLSHHQLRTAFIDDIEDLMYSKLRKDLVFSEPKVNYVIRVKEVQNRRLIQPYFFRKDARGRDETIATAREAELRIDLEQQVVWVHMLHGSMTKDGGDTIFFEKEVIPVPLPPIAAARRVRAREMTSSQIDQRREERVQRLAALERTHAELQQEQPVDSHAAKARTAQLDALYWQAESVRGEINELDTEAALRPALSMGCLFFVLIGCPVGIWFHKADFLSAFVTCFLPIVTVYYPLLLLGLETGKSGRLDPTWFMWTGNAVLGSAGLFLLWRLLRR